MGWSGGSLMLEELVKAVERQFDAEDCFDELVELYTEFVGIMEDCDADTLDECTGISDPLDKALKDLYPNWFE